MASAASAALSFAPPPSMESEFRRTVLQELVEIVDRHRIFACGIAQGEEPVFLLFEIAGIEFDLRQEAVEIAVGFLRQRKSLFERTLRAFDGLARLVAHAAQALEGGGQRAFGAAIAAQRPDGRRNILGDAAGIHQEGALAGELFFLALHRREHRQLVDDMAQIIGIGGGGAGGVAQRLHLFAGRIPGGEARGDIGQQAHHSRRRHRAACDGSRHRTGRDRRTGHGSRP